MIHLYLLDFPVLALEWDDLVVPVEGYSGHDHGLEVGHRVVVVGAVMVRRPAGVDRLGVVGLVVKVVVRPRMDVVVVPVRRPVTTGGLVHLDLR